MQSLIGRIEGQTNGRRDQGSGGSIGRRTDKCTMYRNHCKMCVKCEFLLYKMLIDLFLNSLNIMSFTASIPDQFSSCVRSKCVCWKVNEIQFKIWIILSAIYFHLFRTPPPPTPNPAPKKRKKNKTKQQLHTTIITIRFKLI